MLARRNGAQHLRVVVTGGPCAGKTEVWRFLGSRFPHAAMVPETATELILSGQTRERLGVEGFQRRLFHIQRAREDNALKENPFLFIDRGLADGKAYYPELFASLGVSSQEILGRYDLLVQLEVLQDPDAYNVYAGANPARRESHEEALELGRTIHRIYREHPAHYYLEGSLEEKKSKAVRIVLKRLGLDQA